MTSPHGTGSDYADAVRDVLDHAAKSAQATGQVIVAKQPFLTRPPVVTAIFVIFVGTLIFNIRFARRPVAAVTPAAAEASAQVSVMIATQVLEQYKQENGSLPESLEDIGLDADQFDYRQTGDGHFELGNAVEGATVTYDSREGPASLLRDLGVPLDGPPAPSGNNRE